MQLETERLMLRPWRDEDAEDLYKYASDPRVGPSAGWSTHKDIAESHEVIKTVLGAKGTFAAVLKETGEAIGSVGLMTGEQSELVTAPDEAEIGYWVGVPHWGKGLVPEAVRELLRYSFEELRCSRVWCGYFDGNDKSRRVQEKCGFKYQYTREKAFFPHINEYKVEHVTCITREDWEAAQKR